MKIIVSFSGGKDSQACLIQATKQYGADKIEAVFCDTGWEHPDTYQHITDTCSQMGVKLTTLKSKHDFVSLAVYKKRFPSTNARTFFPPTYIPKYACTNRQYPTVEDVFRYVTDKNATLDAFEPEGGYACMSMFHGLCE